jgi:outer membrane protein OmpA-like peptidoglycan-associated protein
VTISLERIQFPANSAVLRPSEQTKLDAVAKILEKYPSRDVLITGHTALFGTAAGRQELSLRRAQAVGDYLLSLGAKKQSQITVRGAGAADPIASNSTQAGRERNRRVDITILEN